jgi:hypothetical protein
LCPGEPETGGSEKKKDGPAHEDEYNYSPALRVRLSLSRTSRTFSAMAAGVKGF